MSSSSETSSGADSPHFVGVDIQAFRDATRDIGFDVYLKLSETNYAHVFSRATGLDYKRLAQYMQKGVTTLYLKPEDHEAFRAFVSKPAHAVFDDPNTPTEKKIATLLNMTEQNITELFSQLPVSEETANASKRVIRGYVDLMTQSPNTLAVLLKLVSHGEYLYYHSIAVSIFSMLIAKATGQFNRESLESVGLGGFMHDVGCSLLPKGVTCSPENLTEAQWREMKTHPQLGLQLLEGAKNIPAEARYIVYQHHEEPGGKGYPNSLASTAIYYPAKIVEIADAFSALISRRPFRPAFSVDQAMEMMQKDPKKHDPELVRVMMSVLLRESKGKKAA